MSNKGKLQQQQQQQQPPSQHQQQQPQQQQQQQPEAPHQQQQQQQQQTGLKQQVGLEPLPPRYQPPPQPGILKSQPGYVAASGLSHHQQLQQQHQQQAARLANQVKEAVQSKFVQKLDLPHHQQHHHHHHNHQQQLQSTRSDKLSSGYGLQSSKGYLPSGIPTLSSSSSSSGPGTVTPTGAIPAAGPVISSSGVNVGVTLTFPNGQGATIPNTTTNNGRQRITDEDFLRLGPVEMLKFVRKTESDMARLAAEQHRQIQSLVNELRAMKEANQRLSDDNQELRDLCCFLDDDRQKGRKLAREWQRFGRYTASVMRQEVSAYQNKLRQLDNKQQELIKDNLELKELCLYLDEERGGGAGGQRDDGDGSSSSTNADESALPAPPRLSRHHHHHHPASATFNDQTMQYVRSLEQRVKQLEEDKSILQARAQAWPAEAPSNEVWESPRSPGDELHLGGRPEAVVRALQVLEVREQLEREAGHDGEKALVREMCNVVWRKLEEGPAQNRH